MDHEMFDKRNYPVVDVKQGYGEWAQTYEQIVQDEMDLRLFKRVQTADWNTAENILDLACGTGRIGVWMRERTNATIDGVDITPEMMEKAGKKGVYRNLTLAPVTQTGLDANTYDLCTQSLADEHLPELAPLYAETSRIIKPGGKFVIVGFHPHFLMAGMPTHYDRANGESATIKTYVHLLSDHVKAAHTHGWTLTEMDEGLVDEAWLQKKPKWEKYRGLPISCSMVWQH